VILLYRLAAPALLIAPTVAFAANWPDVAPPCNTTLQACINGVPNGSTVMVRSSAEIDPGDYLYVQKPLTLAAAPGFRPTLAAGSTISASYNPGAGVNWSLTIDGFRLLDGGVIVQVGSGNANVTLSNLDVTTDNAVPNFTSGIGIRNNGTGTVTAEIANNRVRVDIDDVSQPSAIYYDSSAGNVSARVHDNRIIGLGSQGIRGFVAYTTGTSTLLVYSNQISGNVGYGIGATPFNANVALQFVAVDNVVTSTSGSGYGFFVTTASNGTFDAQVFNNTFAGFLGGVAISNPGALSGRFANNIVAYNTYGLSIPLALASTVTNDHNLVFGNGSDNFTPGAGTVTSDPLFVRGVHDARLTAGSPAIGAADSVALRALLVARSIPEIDADGLRRFKGTGNLADIGGYEFGDFSVGHRVRASNTTGSASTTDHPALNNLASLRPIITPTRLVSSYGAATNLHVTGLDYSSGRHRIRNEDGATFTLGSAFNVFAPSAGDGVLLHSSSAANVFGFGTQISNAYLNGHPNRIVLATHRQGGLFNHPAGVSYAFGNWFIWQSDATTGSSFPTGIDFHVYAQDPSLNAFHWVAPEAGVGSSTLLDQHVINGEPCAQIYVQPGYNATNPHPVGLRYLSATRRWRVENLDGATMPNGSDFYIVVDEAETAACRYDHIFHSEFDPVD
jgi:hypothetical protein